MTGAMEPCIAPDSARPGLLSGLRDSLSRQTWTHKSHWDPRNAVGSSKHSVFARTGRRRRCWMSRSPEGDEDMFKSAQRRPRQIPSWAELTQHCPCDGPKWHWCRGSWPDFIVMRVRLSSSPQPSLAPCYHNLCWPSAWQQPQRWPLRPMASRSLETPSLAP